MKSIKILCVSVCLVFVSQGINAQERTAKKYDDPQWYSVVHVDYKAGTYNKARKIVADYFMKASENAGTPGPVMVLELNSGKYDIMAVWHMKEGIESMNWDISPDDIKWRNALNELAGSPEKAGEILKEYQSYVASSSNEIARRR